MKRLITVIVLLSIMCTALASCGSSDATNVRPDKELHEVIKENGVYYEKKLWLPDGFLIDYLSGVRERHYSTQSDMLSAQKMDFSQIW